MPLKIQPFFHVLLKEKVGGGGAQIELILTNYKITAELQHCCTFPNKTRKRGGGGTYPQSKAVGLDGS